MSDVALQRVIVVGASAGGVEALRDFVAGMPKDLPAAVFVAVHAPPYTHSSLPEILSRSGPLRATHALHNEPIEAGRIYVAPPDNHLKVRVGRVEVVRGPRENGHRPAVDVLFRSAASAYGTSVIGIVLSGALDCGTSGLRAIKARGGMAIVQDPNDAIFGDMPSSALRYAHPDLVLHANEMGARLGAIVADGATADAGVSDEPTDPRVTTRVPSFVTCPLCHGSMTETTDGEYAEYGCHVGHTFSLNSLVAEQAEELEAALWAAIRSFTESEALARRVAQSAHGEVAARFLEKAETMKRNAKLVESLIADAPGLTPTDAQLAIGRAKSG